MADSEPASPPDARSTATSDDDRFAQLLAELHTDLIAGRTSTAVLADTHVGESTDERLGRAVACLRRLERVRRVYAERFSFAEDFRPSGSSGEQSRPRRLGRFEIQREIGRGGQSVVFLARDPILGRQVALKVPRPEVLLTDTLRERFLREGRATSALKHPNLLTVYEAGELGSVVYLAQAYCPGPTLADWLKRRSEPVPCRTAAVILADLAAGIAHAHGRGVLHRDLKPSNVLLEPREPSGGDARAGRVSLTREAAGTAAPPNAFAFTPQIGDFGLAKLLDEAGEATASGVLLGTFAYMAPEQAAGQPGASGRPADIYGLGTILYELLVGRPPFVSDSVTETLRQVALDEPTRPANLRADVPRDLEAICLKCLEKTPARRYASAEDLADDLNRFLRGEPTRVRPLSHAERLAKWCRRNPALAGLAVVTSVAAIAVTGVSLWANARLASLLGEARSARRVADERTQVAERYAYTADLRLLGQALATGHLETGRQILARHAAEPGLARLRGFEWWYLWREFHERSRVVVRLPGGATAVAACRPRGWIAAGGSDGRVRLFDDRRVLVRELVPSVPAKVNALAFSADGALLAAACEDGLVRLWQSATGRSVGESLNHEGWVAAVAFSPDGKRLASGGEDRVIRLWATADGTPCGELRGHADTVRALAFHPTQPLLVSTAEDATVRAWNTETLAPDSRLATGELTNVTESWAPTLVIEENGDSLCAAFRNGDIVFWDLRPGRFGLARAPSREPVRVRAVAAGPDSRLALGFENSLIRSTWFGAAATNDLVTLHGHDDRIEALAFGPGEKELVSASRDGTVRQWQFESRLGNLTAVVSRQTDRPLIWRENWLALVTQEGVIRVMSMPAMSLLDEVTVDEPTALAIAPRHGWLAWGDSTPRVLVRNAADQRNIVDLPLGERALALDFSPDGTRLLVTSATELTVVEVPTGAHQPAISLPTTSRRALWLADSRHCVSGGDDGWLRVWDGRAGKLALALAVDDSPVVDLDLSPSGEQLLTMSDSRKVRFWHTGQWQVRGSLTLDREPFGLRFLGDTGRLVACHRDGALEVLEFERGSTLLRLPGYGNWPGCAVTTAGDQVAVNVRDQLWILDGRPVAHAEAGEEPEP